MLFSLLLELSSSSPAWAERPSALRALAYALVNAGDASLAQGLHDRPGSGERPFTIAILPEVRPRAIIRARVTALDEPAAAALRTGAAGLLAGDGTVSFGRETVQLSGCRRDLPPLAEATHYADLVALPFSPFAPLSFITPIAFSQGGDRHLPLPVPDLLMRGWARRWNRFAPTTLSWSEEVVSGVIARVGLAHMEGKTVTVPLRPGKVVGFVGTATLEALQPRSWHDADRRAFTALTTFSRFCGSGARTTQGMGLTLPENR